MSTPSYPAGSVRSLLNTAAVTPATARALKNRLQMATATPVFFDAQQYYLLSCLCDCLLGQLPEKRLVNMAAFIDERLAAGKTDGWRYNHMPPDGELYSQGLQGINETSIALFGNLFTNLPREQQLTVLHRIQRGTAPSAIWEQLSPVTFFEEVLAEATEIFYAHPLAQEEIGYVGMADAQGWQKIGLNEKEIIEPREIKSDAPVCA
jgi:gluconate 2-dehydrogenase gamma chain